MNDKERFERIKNDYYGRDLDYNDIVWLIEKDIDWLIERVEQLQQEIASLKEALNESVKTSVALDNELQQEQAKTERYEKALREIANEQEVGEGDFNAADVANNLIATAKEALEGAE